jgi:recombination protein RecT
MRAQLLATLPSHISYERFQRVVLTAINVNPDLLGADHHSLFIATTRAAQDGLLPDGREGAFVIFKDKSGKRLVTWMPMLAGLLRKIRQSGEIDSIGARIVYQNEIDQGRFKFVIEDGQEKLFHDPMLWGDRGAKVLVYAYARFKATGHVEYAPLHRDDIMKRRAMSRAKDSGPWKDWEDEMWLKTAIRKLAARLPLSAEIMKSVTRDEEPSPTEFERMKTAALQDSTTAMHQLGAPEPEPESLEGADATVIDDDPDQYAKDILQTALDKLADDNFPDHKELDEFASRIRDILKTETHSDELRDRLLGEFNAAFLDKKRTMEKLV